MIAWRARCMGPLGGMSRCDLFCLWERVRRKTEPWWKPLAGPVVVLAGKGSFDCTSACAKRASTFSAQDDIAYEAPDYGRVRRDCLFVAGL